MGAKIAKKIVEDAVGENRSQVLKSSERGLAETGTWFGPGVGWGGGLQNKREN